MVLNQHVEPQWSGWDWPVNFSDLLLLNQAELIAQQATRWSMLHKLHFFMAFDPVFQKITPDSFLPQLSYKNLALVGPLYSHLLGIIFFSACNNEMMEHLSISWWKLPLSGLCAEKWGGYVNNGSGKKGRPAKSNSPMGSPAIYSQLCSPFSLDLLEIPRFFAFRLIKGRRNDRKKHFCRLCCI